MHRRSSFVGLGAGIELAPVTVKASMGEILTDPSQRLRADSATGKQSRAASRERPRRAASDLARLAADATSCQRCPLYEMRRRLFSVKAQWTRLL